MHRILFPAIGIIRDPPKTEITNERSNNEAGAEVTLSFSFQFTILPEALGVTKLNLKPVPFLKLRQERPSDAFLGPDIGKQICGKYVAVIVIARVTG